MLLLLAYYSSMEKWRTEFKDIPEPEVEITFWIKRHFYAIDPDAPYGGNRTDIKLPFVIETEENTAYLPSKEAIKHRKSFLEYCRRVIELEKNINKSTDGKGPNLWYSKSVKGNGILAWDRSTVCPYTIDEGCCPLLSRMADLSQTGEIYRHERHTKDDDEVIFHYATADHVFIVEHEYSDPDTIYKSIRINRPAFSKSYQEAIFRAGSIMEYVRAGLKI